MGGPPNGQFSAATSNGPACAVGPRHDERCTSQLRIEDGPSRRMEVGGEPDVEGEVAQSKLEREPADALITELEREVDELSASFRPGLAEPITRWHLYAFFSFRWQADSTGWPRRQAPRRQALSLLPGGSKQCNVVFALWVQQRC